MGAEALDKTVQSTDSLAAGSYRSIAELVGVTKFYTGPLSLPSSNTVQDPISHLGFPTPYFQPPPSQDPRTYRAVDISIDTTLKDWKLIRVESTEINGSHQDTRAISLRIKNPNDAELKYFTNRKERDELIQQLIGLLHYL